VDDWKEISARRLSICEVCSKQIPKGAPLVWSRARSVVRCVECRDLPLPKTEKKRVSKVVGVAGASAKKQYEARSKKDSSKVEFLHPRLAKLLRVDNVDSATTKKWKKGAEGEEEIGKALTKFIKKNGGLLLQDRAVPGTKKNIDHILIRENAVFVIDSKNFSGELTIKNAINKSEVRELLYIKNYTQTKLVDKVKEQVEVVQKSLKSGGFKVDTVGYLVFYGVEWPKDIKATQVDGVLLNGNGVAEPILNIKARKKNDVEAIGAYLETTFPPR